MSLNKSIVMATKYFAEKVLDVRLKTQDERVSGGAYCASIDVIGSPNYIMSVYIGEQSLKKMSELFLFIDDPDDETKQDLVCEIANVIVGRAKVEASEKLGYKFDISTPKYIGSDVKVPEHDMEINFGFEDEVFTIIGKKA